MQLVDSLTIGVNIRLLFSEIVETSQLLFNIVLLVLLYRCAGLFSDNERFNRFADRLSGMLGGE